jgi:acylphosphatase
MAAPWSAPDADAPRFCLNDVMSEQSALHITVRGRVQGVGYRAFIEREALSAGVGGWVRNLRDGSVEAVLQGHRAVLDPLIETCRQGPFSARVDALDRREATPDEFALRRPGELFSVLPTR